MCGLIDKALPVIGGIAGFAIGGPVGAGIGAGLGGFAGNYAQTHNFGSALEGGAISGATSYLGSNFFGGVPGMDGAGAGGNYEGAFSGGLGGNAATGADALEQMGLSSSAAGDLASNTAANAGSLESGLGGSAMFGANAGTGVAGGDQLMGSLGGLTGGNTAMDTAGLGIAGGGYTSALGGGSGTLGQSLGGAAQMGASPVGGAGAAPGQPQDLSGAVSSNPTNMGSGALAPEGAQAAPMSTNPALLSQTGVAPAQDQGLSTLYGPNSTASGSPTGSVIDSSGAANGVGNTISSIPGTGGGGMGGSFDWSSPQGLQAIFGLAKSGLGAYQQYQQGQAANRYAADINNQFAPNSPYAQQMQQELARKDAAAGRNSQYGSRAVQLAAALTQARAQALGGSNYAQARQNTSGASMLNSLFSNFAGSQPMQQGVYSLGNQAYQGLQGLFQ